MLYRQEPTDFAFNPAHSGDIRESLLMRSRGLRYDRPHGGTADGREADGNASSAGEARMDINGPGSVGSSGPVRPGDHVRPAETIAPTPRGIEMPVDEVEISAAAQMLERLSSDPAVREARLAEIQAQISAGTYETPEKLEAAIMRMMSDLA